jgi:uncharacterized protein (DUF488 family)
MPAELHLRSHVSFANVGHRHVHISFAHSATVCNPGRLAWGIVIVINVENLIRV